LFHVFIYKAWAIGKAPRSPGFFLHHIAISSNTQGMTQKRVNQ